MRLTGTRIPGFQLDRKGRLVRATKRLDVSAQLRRKASKRVRVVRRQPVSDDPGHRNP